MELSNGLKEEIAAAFLARIRGDLAKGRRLPLSDYLSGCPPEHQRIIAEEYLQALRPGLPKPESIDPPSPSPSLPVWTADPPQNPLDPADLEPAMSLGAYRLVRQLGQGGQGAVWLAEDTRLERTVALKVLNRLGPASGEALRRFRREAEIASRLDHPGICPVYDVGVESGLPYIAMRHVAGETLAQQIANAKGDSTASENPPGRTPSGPRTERELGMILRLFEDAATAIHAAHEARIIHRDVKPGNIMVTPEGRPVLLDFGLAREVEDDATLLTRTGVAPGTLSYMSPEQLGPGGVPLDRRTDVYSLGVTLYEVLTLRRPFEAPTQEALSLAIQNAEPPSPRRLNPAIPADLAIVVATALAKDRNRRYQTALDFAEDLRRVRVREPIRARAPGLLVRLWRFAQRRPAVAALVIVLTAALPAISTLVAHAAASQSRIRSLEEAQRDTEAGDLVAEGFGQLQLDQFEPALEAFEKALELRPDDPETHAAALIALAGARGPEAALSRLDSDPVLTRRHPDLERLRISFLKQTGKMEEAERISRTLEPPRGATGCFLAGLAALDGSGTKSEDGAREALDLFDRAVYLSSHLVLNYHYAVARAAGRLPDDRAARRIAGILESLRPEEPKAWFYSGVALQRVDPDRAVLAWNKAVQLAPDDSRSDSARFNLGNILRSKGDLEAAAGHYRNILSRSPDHASAWLNLGLTLLAMGRKDLALEAHRKAVALEPRSSMAVFDLGVALESSALIDEAIEKYREAIKLNPLHVRARTNLGLLLASQRKWEDAVAELKEAVAAEPRDPKARTNLGYALQEMGRRDEAIAAYQEVLAETPGYVLAHENLAAALYAAGDFEGAALHFAAAAEREPDDASHQARLGRVLFDLGRFREALAHLHRALDLGIPPEELRRITVELIARCQQITQIEDRLLAYAGKVGPEPPVEDVLQLADALHFSPDPERPLRLYREVMTRTPGLVKDLGRRIRSNAALVAVRAGTAKGTPEDVAGVRRRATLRREALGWLRAEAQDWQSRLEDDRIQSEWLKEETQRWLDDNQFSAVRDAAALAGFPEDERLEWEGLWAGIRALRRDL